MWWFFPAKAKSLFEEWWSDPKNDYDRDKGSDQVDLKPEWGNTQAFFRDTKSYMGDLFNLLLKARANSVGVKCDATTKQKETIIPESKTCYNCTANTEETLSHLLLQCTGQTEARTPLITFVNLLPREDQDMLREQEQEGTFMNHILGGDSPQLTKIAMECLSIMLHNITSQKISNQQQG